MRTPYATRRLRLTDANREAWAEFQRANARAAEQYEHLPIAHWTHGTTRRCRDCGGWTYDHAGVCWACRGREGRRS